MPEFWMHHIDTACLFRKAEYIFEFEGRRYKLIRGTEKEFDKLCIITDGSNKENEESHETTMRLLDYLAWEFGQPIRYVGAGGQGYPEGKITLETALINSFHGRTLRGSVVDISCIPNVTNSTQRLALSLWNEAKYSNSLFLGFINYWKILELPSHGKKIKGRAHERAIKWINSVPSHRVYMGKEIEKILVDEKIDLGTYLYDRCRNAIAHVTRQPILYSGKIADRNKIYRAYLVAEDLAKYHIREELGLKGYPIGLKVIKTRERTSALKLMRKIRK
jgi:hypothetical protein